MAANVTNQVAFLRTSRSFPADLNRLSTEVNLAYVDIANKVNSRTISIFSQNVAALNGEEWFVNNKNQKQQGFRRVYPFGAITTATNIAHGLNIPIIQIVRIFGTFTNGTTWYPLPYVDVVAANNQVNVIVTSTNIVITPGAGSPPSISSGYVVLEWLSQP